MRRVEPDARSRPRRWRISAMAPRSATNALIQHRGVKTGLVTTDGFRDLLEIGRQKRPDLYDCRRTSRRRWCRATCATRCRSACATTAASTCRWTRRRCARPRKALQGGGGAGGRRLLPLRLRPPRAREARASRSCARKCPTPSSAPAMRSRPSSASTSACRPPCVNAYLGPVMRNYIERLTPRLRDLGMTATPHLTQSNGGVIGFEHGRRDAGARGAVRAFHRRRRRAGDRPRRRASRT